MTRRETKKPKPDAGGERRQRGRKLSRFAGFFASATLVWCAVGIAAIGFLESRARWDGSLAPAGWAEAAKPADRLVIEGRQIAYWGRPDARYSRYATRGARKPIAVVVHFTMAKPVRALVEYGHKRDYGRGGASFGYHFYIGRDGHIVQGAPLSRRTNHIKFRTHGKRTAIARHLWSGNTIAVSLVGGCDPLMRPDWRRRRGCSSEFSTDRQTKAGLAVIRALQEKFGMACAEVYGHGELQVDRRSFEGRALSRLARDTCPSESS